MAPPRISRESVLAKARELFAEVGDPTMEQLAVAAGVSPASLYKLFGTRRSLMAELGLCPPPRAAERIVASAAELLAERGLVGLSVEEAATRAGVSRRSAYRLFPGKGALFREVVRAFAPLEDGAVLVRSMWDRPPAEVLQALAASVAGLDRVQLAVWRIVFFELGEGTDEAFAYAMDSTAFLVGYIAQQMSAGRLRRMDPQLATMAYAGPIVMYLVSQERLGPELVSDIPATAALEELVALWLRSMQPTPATPSSGWRRG